jgi:hypothetical protein
MLKGRTYIAEVREQNFEEIILFPEVGNKRRLEKIT